MPKHLDKGKPSLSRDDRRALELFEDAQRQFHRYQELRDVTAVLTSQETIEPPVPTWDSPLTLVIRN